MYPRQVAQAYNRRGSNVVAIVIQLPQALPLGPGGVWLVQCHTE